MSIASDEAIFLARRVLALFDLSRNQQRAVLAVACSALHTDEHAKFRKQVQQVSLRQVMRGVDSPQRGCVYARLRSKFPKSQTVNPGNV